MPKREDIKKILLIGSGPIVIGQACEFDYSGTQACKALREEGYEVVLLNSNPATIMTDPDMSDRTYIEPVTPEVVEKIIALERPDALLPTLGGQTGLNVAIQVAEMGVLERYGVEMIGAKHESIKKAEERDLFKKAMEHIGLDLPRSGYARTLDEARAVRDELGLPCVIRPSFTLGGTGGGIAYNVEDFDAIVATGLDYSLSTEVLVEESVIGWKEFELEVMRDCRDNAVIVCSIENLDPMGVHTGDSITVVPAQTLTDKEYQVMRDAALAIMREIGVDTGGSNVQFAIHPDTGRLVVIEMNPRVSRSSALASKATGFPIAKIAAKVAVGYTLDEIANDITRETPACFEPTIDYCVVKVPRFTFEKFPEADPTLTTSMKSVGETMAIGRTFKEALQKAIRSLEIGRPGLVTARRDSDAEPTMEALRSRLRIPNGERLFHIRDAFRRGFNIHEVARLTRMDPWFLDNIQQIVDFEQGLERYGRLADVPRDTLREAKRMGFSDEQLARLWKASEDDVRSRRHADGIRPTYKLVDTCAAEFEAYTPYYYSTYEDEDECRVSDRKKIMILGGGPNRIGQGIEFDYCCVQAAFALRDLGYESIMVNSNPETVSTDYDTSDLLFFEPITREDVLNIWDRLQPQGAIVQFGGQTPLNIAKALQEAGVKIIGTSPDSIDLAEDRERFQQLLHRLGLRQPDNGITTDIDAALRTARRIGYPVLVRPSFVLGGRAMEIVYSDDRLAHYMREAVHASPDRPVLIDKFLDDATEVDVDAIADGQTVVVAGVMEHIEQAGVHSGDSAMVLPPHSLPEPIVAEIRRQTHALAFALRVKGLMNVQFAVKDGLVYVLEVNPRASRTVPFVSKAIGVSLARLATKVMTGLTLQEVGFTQEVAVEHYAVKESVFPFDRFPGVDVILGPEMRSTGEVMGINSDFDTAFAKSQLAASQNLPLSGAVLLSVRDKDKAAIVDVARRLHAMGFRLLATSGTRDALARAGVAASLVRKLSQGRPHPIDCIKNGQIDLVMITPTYRGAGSDEGKLRAALVQHKIPYVTTMPAALAVTSAIETLRRKGYGVKALQDYHAQITARPA